MFVATMEPGSHGWGLSFVRGLRRCLPRIGCTGTCVGKVAKAGFDHLSESWYNVWRHVQDLSIPILQLQTRLSSPTILENH